MQHTVRRIAGVLGVAFLGGCTESVGPGDLSPEDASGRGGRTRGSLLSIVVTATGFHERQQEFDWTLDKRVKDILDERMLPEASISETLIKPGQGKWIHYEFTGTRTLAETRVLMGARGQVCVVNSGDESTEGLLITTTIQRKTNAAWIDVSVDTVPLVTEAALAAGESTCYPYETQFDGTAGDEYRVNATVTSTNHSDHRGTPFGPGASAGFTLPEEAVATTKDATATIYDDIIMMCSKIFPSIICTGSERFQPITLGRTTTFTSEGVIDLYNYHVCGEDLKVTNYAKIVEGGPYAPGVEPESDDATATITVRTGDCPPKPAEPGCTLTQGYWKNHVWPKHPMWGTLNDWPDINGWKFFDTDIEWHDMLDVSPGGDAYFILAHQYIAAVLNQQNGTNVPEEVRETLVAAYDYFSLPRAAREAVPRQQLISWATLLDRYNNGQLGVPHCD